MSSKQYPLESLLRPPVEWYTVCVCLLGVGLMLYSPSLFFIRPLVANIAASLLSLFAVLRTYQGWQAVRYQRYLRRLPYYALSSDNIPVSHKKLFLGKGFKWEASHTQRYYECQQPWAKRFLKMPFYYELARKLEVKWENKKGLNKIARLLGSSSRFNPVRPLPPVGGNTTLHGVEMHEKSVLLPLTERVGHTLVLGTTRVGKTRLLEVMVTQDIRRGDVVIVFDPKGDGDLLKRIVGEATAANREDDVIIFHLGFPDISSRYNPVGNFARITEVANRVANQLPGSGESATFREFAWRFVNIIAKALVAIGKKPDYEQIQRYILNIDELLKAYCKQWLTKIKPDWQASLKQFAQTVDLKQQPNHMKARSFELLALVRFIEQLDEYDAIAAGLCSAFNYDKTYFDKITASLLPLIEKLTSGRVAELISPNYDDIHDTRAIFDWMSVIRAKKIVYVGLDALSDSTVAGAVGNSMFADLCSVAGQLYKYGLYDDENKAKALHPICIHSDEFNELIGDEFIPLINKAGGAHFQMTAYTQTLPDIEAKLESRAKAGQVIGNFNTLICLRVLGLETAEMLTQKLPQKVSIKALEEVSSVTDNQRFRGDHVFTSSNQDHISKIEVPMLSPYDLVSLPKGQAFVWMEGGQLWKCRMPLPKTSKNKIPDSVTEMVEIMNEHKKNRLQQMEEAA